MRQDAGVDGDAQRISQLCWLFFLKIIDDQDQELELLDARYESPIPAKFQWRDWAADPEGFTGEALLSFVNGELFPTLKGLLPIGPAAPRRQVAGDVFEEAYNYMKSGQLLRQVVNKINDIDFNNLADRQHFGDLYERILNDLQSAGNAGEYYTPAPSPPSWSTGSTPSRRDPVRPGLRHRRLPDLLDPRHARALCEASRGRKGDARRLARGGEEAVQQHVVRDQHAAARRRGRRLRAPRQHPGPAVHQLGAEGPGRYRPDQPAVRRPGRGRYRVQLAPTRSANCGRQSSTLR
jgi:hypothetical protein